jgi:hypothetical protein
MFVLFAAFVLATTTLAEAKGCLKGALAGGLAGHFVHHTVMGAAAGCYMGHHVANQKPASPEKTAPAPKESGGGRNY